jgi:hypothetical protein
MAITRPPADSAQPIFIVSPAPRSGTNYFLDLLCLHPACAPYPVYEDFFLAYSHLLALYARATGQMALRPKSALPQRYDHLLQASLGDGLARMIQAQVPGKRAVLKTPSLGGLDNFHLLFPDAKLLIILRDGRDQVESFLNSFPARNPRFHQLVRGWAGSVTGLRRHLARMDRLAYPYLLVRYEDLFIRNQTELRRVFAFCGLDPEAYDYARAAQLPIRGSSEHLRQGSEWKPVPRTPEFQPIGRWKSWPRSRRAFFSRTAGRHLKRWGYDPDCTAT